MPCTSGSRPQAKIQFGVIRMTSRLMNWTGGPCTVEEHTNRVVLRDTVGIHGGEVSAVRRRIVFQFPPAMDVVVEDGGGTVVIGEDSPEE